MGLQKRHELRRARSVSRLGVLTSEERELAPAAPPPRTADAMKAVLTDARFSDSGWSFERKLDGIRCIAILLRRAEAPFADPGAIRERGVSWVEPQLVAEVGFIEWTGHGRLRHPRFLGLRDDKAASEVVREA